MTGACVVWYGPCMADKLMTGNHPWDAGAVVQDRRTGRLTSGRGLSEKQKIFVREYSRGASATAAATVAGYSRPSTDGYRERKNPAVLQAIREAQTAQLGSLAGVAINTMRDVMTDETAPAAARISAAKWALEAAGFGLESQKAQLRLGLGEDKPLSEMTADELADFIVRRTDERKRANDAQTNPAIDAEVIEDQGVADEPSLPMEGSDREDEGD
jgi:hypothetical protein